MIHLPKDFSEFLKLLNLKQVEYLVVGGWAVGYYGYPRGTGDIDIWISSTKENALKLIEVFKDFGFEDSEISPDIFLKKDQITRIGMPPLRIEILTTISGVNFEECYKNRKRVTVDNVEIDFISLKDLKANKAAAKRLKDIDDLDKLIEY
jgi:predicted nucleotidyltransferase